MFEITKPCVPKSSTISVEGCSIVTGKFILTGWNYLWVKNIYSVPLGLLDMTTNPAELESIRWSIEC